MAENIDIVMNADTGHPHLGVAITEIARVAMAVHQTIGGKTTIEALLCVYCNMALGQVGLAEVQSVLTRALEKLPELDRTRQLLGQHAGAT